MFYTFSPESFDVFCIVDTEPVYENSPPSELTPKIITLIGKRLAASVMSEFSLFHNTIFFI